MTSCVLDALWLASDSICRGGRQPRMCASCSLRAGRGHARPSPYLATPGPAGWHHPRRKRHGPRAGCPPGAAAAPPALRLTATGCPSTHSCCSRASHRCARQLMQAAAEARNTSITAGSRRGDRIRSLYLIVGTPQPFLLDLAGNVPVQGPEAAPGHVPRCWRRAACRAT